MWGAIAPCVWLGLYGVGAAPCPAMGVHGGADRAAAGEPPCTGCGCCLRDGSSPPGARSCLTAQPLAASLLPAARSTLGRLPGAWLGLQHPRPCRTTPLPGPPDPIPHQRSESGAPRPLPRGLPRGSLLSSPSWTRRMQQRGKGGGKSLSSAPTLEPGPRRVPAAPGAEQTELLIPTHCDPTAPAPVPRCCPVWNGCGSF